jgi:hypothetical protein
LLHFGHEICRQSFGGGCPPLALACVIVFPHAMDFFPIFSTTKEWKKIELSTKSKLRKPKSRTLGFLEIEDNN